MKVIRNNVFPFGKFDAINICGLIFSKVKVTPSILRHEYIHTLQQIEMLVIGFYLWYGIEWTINMIRYRNPLRAYFNISFEREAYCCEADPLYPRKRKLWAWTKFLKCPKNYRF